MITIKTANEIKKMQKAAEIVKSALKVVKAHIAVGVTTSDLDKICEETILGLGGIPSFKGYRGFPNTICASVNQEVVHGIPGDRPLKEGDIIGVDVGASVEGYHADAARTFPVGRISDEAKRLIRVTEESFYEGIERARDGFRLHDISSAIQKHVESHGYSVVRVLSGHGIGQKLHEEPDVPNFGIEGRGVRLVSGMTIAVEPMVNEGNFEVLTEKNGWTVVTKDNSLSAHYENTIIITKGKPMIITLED